MCKHNIMREPKKEQNAHLFCFFPFLHSLFFSRCREERGGPYIPFQRKQRVSPLQCQQEEAEFWVEKPNNTKILLRFHGGKSASCFVFFLMVCTLLIFPPRDGRCSPLIRQRDCSAKGLTELVRKRWGVVLQRVSQQPH